VRDALATLPWVEPDTITPDKATLKVSFGINDRDKFDFEELKGKLGAKYQKGLKLEQAPQ
jgi:hypothetical protein